MEKTRYLLERTDAEKEKVYMRSDNCSILCFSSKEKALEFIGAGDEDEAEFMGWRVEFYYPDIHGVDAEEIV